MCSMVAKMKSLHVLNVSKCHITDSGLIHIVYLLLNRYVNLRVLILHWNQIREKGSIALARALRKNKSLQILDISFNSLGTGQLYKKRKLPRKRRKVKDMKDLDWEQVAAIELRDSDSESEGERYVEYKPLEKYTKSAFKWG